MNRKTHLKILLLSKFPNLSLHPLVQRLSFTNLFKYNLCTKGCSDYIIKTQKSQ